MVLLIVPVMSLGKIDLSRVGEGFTLSGTSELLRFSGVNE
jgi:hypothetical protein